METRRLLRYEEVVWMKHRLLPYLSKEDKINIIHSGNHNMLWIQYGKIRPKCSYNLDELLLFK